MIMRLSSRAQRSTKRSGVVRCRPGTQVARHQMNGEAGDLFGSRLSRLTALGRDDKRQVIASIRLDAGGDDDVAPFLDLALQIGGELVGAGGGEYRALAGELLLDLGALHRLDGDGVERGDDRRRR